MGNLLLDIREMIRKFIAFLGNVWKFSVVIIRISFFWQELPTGSIGNPPDPNFPQALSSPSQSLSEAIWSPLPITHNLRLFGSGAEKRERSPFPEGIKVSQWFLVMAIPLIPLALLPHWRQYIYPSFLEAKQWEAFLSHTYCKKCYFKLVVVPNIGFYTWW